MIEKINSLLWGDFTLLMILLCGVFHTVNTGFVQFRLPRLLRSSGGNGKSRAKAVTSALAASMGTGNISGCAAAIAAGGAGAVFWMWLSAFTGMAVAYAENVTGARFAARYGQPASPALYIKKGLGSKKLACVYCIGCVFCAFAMGSMGQSAALCTSVSFETKLSPFIPAAVVTILTAAVIFSGDHCTDGVMRITEKLVPVMGIVYGGSCILLLAVNKADICGAFREIFQSAFSFRAAAGGAAGIAVRKTISTGLRRGVFSNEAGMGSSVLVHSSADFGSPENAGAWAALEVFLDTIVCCTLTALVVLTSDCGAGGITGIFTAGLGKTGGVLTCLSVCLFAWASMLGWCCCGEKALASLTDSRTAAKIYRVLFCAAAAVGGMVSEAFSLGLADIFNVFVMIPNLFAVTFIAVKERQRGISSY